MACFEIRVAAALAVWAAVALAVRPPSSKARAFPPARSPERVPEQEPDGFGAPYRLSSSSADEATGSGPQHTIAADRAGNVHVVWLAADGTIHYREWLRSAGVWLAEDGLSEPRSYVGPPAVACDSAGNVHVVWSAGWSPVELHYRRRDAGSNAWLPEAVITTQGGATPSLACRPNGLDVHVVWSGGDPARIRHVEWTPAGGWSAVGFISSDSTRGTGQASVAVDTAGSVFVTWVQSSAGWPYMSVWLRTRSGGVWVPVEAVSPGVSGWWDQVMADVEATPAGDAHVVWYGASAHAGVFYRAKVGGSWGSIDTVSGGQNYCRPGPGLALAGDTVHVAWPRTTWLEPELSQLYHRERRAGAWQGIDQLTFREQSMVYGVGLAADGFGSVHALWYEYDRVAGNGDPFYARCMFEVGRDVGVRAVLSPERVAIPRPAAVVPAAVAKNLGTQFQTGVPVVCTVFGTGRAVRHAAAAVSGALPPGGIDTVEFGSWVPLPAEAWCVRVSTALAGDERPENDAAEARVLPVEVRTAGAPDAYGMCWVDSDAPTGPEFRWRDITGSGTPVPFPTYDDDCARVPIGFRFNWYGEAFESVYVSTNGVLSFECWWEDYENGALPDERGRAVYVLWDDVHCLGPGRVKYRTVGVAPHETLVVSWDSVRFFGYGDSSLSFQALLVEGEDDAVCQYRDVVTGYWRGDRGMGATLGVEGDRARYREYLQYVYGFETSADPYGNLLVSPRAVRYYGLNRPAPGWSEVEPMPASPLGKGVKDGGWLALDPAGMVYAARGNKTPDFFVYDPAGNANGVWTALPAWPDGPEGRPPYRGAAAVCDNSGHVYAVKGNSTLGFWRFCPDSAVWVRLADVPLGASGKKVKGGTDLACVVENGTGYVYLLKGPETDFVRFNAASGTWDEDLPPAPAGTRPKWDRGSWLVYDGERTLYAHKAKYHELWTFDVPTHSWAAQALPGMPLVGRAGKSKKSKDGGSAAYHGGSIFALKGGNTQEFWRRGEGADWFELDTMPSYGSTGRKKRAKAGADIVSFGGGVFFALKGNRTLELWRYAMPEPGRASESGVVSAAGRLETGRGVRAAPSVVTGGRLQLAGDVAAAARASIYDASGRLVLGPRPAGGGTLDVRGLAAGVYLVRMDGAGRTAATRFVVE